MTPPDPGTATEPCAAAPFTFVTDVSLGAWLADGLDVRAFLGPRDPGVEASCISCPLATRRWFACCTPSPKDRPATGSFAELNARIDAGEDVDLPEIIEGGEVSWREVARVHGTLGEDAELRGDVLSHGLVGLARGESRDEESADGWRYTPPEEGRLTADLFARIAGVLAEHTSTPGRGVAAIWEGYGGLMSSQGVGWFAFAPDGPDWLPRPVRWLRRRLQQRRAEFTLRRRAFGTGPALRHLVLPRAPQPAGSGILSKEVAKGPRLELPGRDHVCFQAGVVDFTDDGWLLRAPWLAPLHPGVEACGPDRSSAQSPNLLWPEDRSWVMVAEIDLDSTLIACSAECADALLAADGVEAVRITRDTALWDE